MNEGEDRLGQHLARILLLALCFCLGIAQGAAGQISGLKDFDNRREGTTVRQNALEDFTFLSVERFAEAFPRNSNIRVRFFLPKLEGGAQKTVFVEAVELQDSTHYFMEAKNLSWSDGRWNTFQPWPTNAVIDPLGLDALNIGVRAGFKVPGRPPVYLPVDVYTQLINQDKRSYSINFITGQDLQSLDISVTDSSGRDAPVRVPKLTCNRSRNPNCTLYAAGSTHAFDLDMSGLPQGEYRVNLIGNVPRTSKQTALEVRVYHAPEEQRH